MTEHEINTIVDRVASRVIELMRPQLITKSEAARRLNISRPTLDKWIETGKVKMTGDRIKSTDLVL